MRKTSPTALALLAAMAAAAGMIAMNRRDLQNMQEVLVPAVEIIRFGDGVNAVARFDTSTGALWRYNGDLRNPQVRGEWVLETPGVSNRPPGAFRLQQAAGASFLVDAATGETWILRQRGPRFDWDLVPEFR